MGTFKFRLTRFCATFLFQILQIQYHTAFEAVFASALTAALALKASSPKLTSTIRPIHSFTSSLQTQVCHSCLVSTIQTIEEMRLMESVAELQTALEKILKKPAVPLMDCLSPSCQYPSAVEKICIDIKEKLAEVKFQN